MEETPRQRDHKWFCSNVREFNLSEDRRRPSRVPVACGDQLYVVLRSLWLLETKTGEMRHRELDQESSHWGQERGKDADSGERNRLEMEPKDGLKTQG